MNGSGVLLDGILHLLIVKRIYESSFDTVLRKGVSQQVVGAAVNVLCGNDVLTFMSQVLKSVCDSCCTGSDSQSRYAAFESCDSFLKNILGRVGQTAVDVSCVTQTKSGCCVIAVSTVFYNSYLFTRISYHAFQTLSNSKKKQPDIGFSYIQLPLLSSTCRQ